MLKVNEKVVTSWFRHAKSSAATAVIVPLVLSTVKEFQKQGFVIGFNTPTFIVLGIAVGIALVTVIGGLALKKRPDLSSEVTLIDTKALEELKALAAKQITHSDIAVTTVKNN